MTRDVSTSVIASVANGSSVAPQSRGDARRFNKRTPLGNGVVMSSDNIGNYCLGTSGVRHYFSNEAERIHAETAAMTFCGPLPKGVSVARNKLDGISVFAEGQEFFLLPDNAWAYKNMREELSRYLHSLRKPAGSESIPKQVMEQQNDSTQN